MVYCKHWKNGHCKDCRKNCPIKKKLMRKAARASAGAKAPRPAATMEFAVAPPALTEALAHGRRVARLAAKLYAGLAPLHRLEAPWDTVLAVAARLHDVGWVYGQKGHHKVSARMIRTKVQELGGLPPFGEDGPGASGCSGGPEGPGAFGKANMPGGPEALQATGKADVPGKAGKPGAPQAKAEAALRALAALVARYHRRADPSPRQRRFAALSGAKRRGVRRMAALLRLADALDYSHANLVHDLEIVIEESAVRLVLHCPGGCAEEIGRVDAKKTLFKKVFKRDVLCQCAKQNASAMPDAERNAEPTPEQAAERPSEQVSEQTPEPTETPEK